MSTKTDFDYESFDWSEYVKHRPPYRPELYALVYDYHTAHSDRWHTAYDIGSGAGICAAELLRRFTHVTLSDPSDNHIAKANDFIAGVPAGRIAVAKHKGEDALAAATESLDMVTVFEAFHWLDPDLGLDNLRRYLRPGGTLAIVMYGVRFALEGAGAAINEAWNDDYEDWLRDAARFLTSSRPIALMQGRLNSVHFDPEQWHDVRRCHYISDQPLADVHAKIETDRVEPGESVERMPDRDMFAVDADAAWIEGYFESVQPASFTAVPVKQRFKRLFEAMGGEKIRITFPAVVILATKT